MDFIYLSLSIILSLFGYIANIVAPSNIAPGISRVNAVGLHRNYFHDKNKITLKNVV